MIKQSIDLNNINILITGAAGFIGASLTLRLLSELEGSTIVGIDTVNDYYSRELKEYRLGLIEKKAEGSDCQWSFQKISITDREALSGLFEQYHFEVVVNLAAQAGVRYSLINPDAFMESNIIGFYTVLEVCRKYLPKHLVFASSSSVYGGNTKVPFCMSDRTDTPISLYAATKKSNELMAYTYAKLYGLPCTGLRFFTVYGPFGRPDMAYYKFADKLAGGEKLQVYNFGNCKRDFTYVDDTIEGVFRVLQGAPLSSVRTEDGSEEQAVPYALYNIGGGNPEDLMEFIRVLSKELGAFGVLPEGFELEEHIEYLPMQPGDVEITYADSTELERDFDFIPKIGIREGLRKFAKWYSGYLRS
ncbi:MAG: NAD-dependent epimerase/dehydratase family protein [Lachnospiraceae bacterium]|nr:NAD-dependent epimerase/dehydratase family protein [Lachnospiraceae bacterium]